jgi:hypothetical protein
MATDRTVAIYPSGTTTPSGYDATYTSMSAMEAAENGDLTSGGGTRLLVEITASDGNWSSNDTTSSGVTFAGWTYDRSSGEYIHIYTLDDGARSSSGNADANAYTLQYTSNGATALIFSEACEIDFTGLQFYVSDQTEWTTKYHVDYAAAANQTEWTTKYHVDYAAAANLNINFRKCYFRGSYAGGNSYDEHMIESAAHTGTILYQNCVIEGSAHGPKLSNGTYKFYNCTLYDLSLDGFERDGGTPTIKNSVVGNCGDDWDGNFTAVTIDFCASDDGQSQDSNHVSLSANHHDDWTDPDGSPYPDFTITDSGSALYLASDISNADDSDVPTDDIAGNSRNTGAGESVCIGAFEYPVAGGSDALPMAMNLYRQFRK